MCKQVQHFKVPGGKDGKILTIGDLIDRTPKDLISKVILEEMLNPAAGAGAVSAIHDAVTLANWIITLKSKSLPEVEKIFKEYYAERYPVAKAAFKTSQLFSKLMTKSLVGFVTKAIFKSAPAWLWFRVIVNMSLVRPQVSFLPLVKDTGSVPPLPQPSLVKTLAILKEQE
ncbi:hypothetical protein BGZ74_005264, partial [Mortierella antarctica]